MSYRQTSPAVPESLQNAWSQLVGPVQRGPKPRLSAVCGEGIAETGSQIEITRELETRDGIRRYEAWDHVLRLQTEVREFVGGGKQEQKAKEEFWYRARFQARQRNTHLLAVYSIDQERGWVITELCRSSMADGLQRDPIDGKRAKQVLIEALTGLAHLHRQGYVHGYIHPGALLLDNNGAVKLDLASGRGVRAQLVQQAGLEQYIAPETLDEQRFGQAGLSVDLYALGVVMVELLAGDKFTKLFLDQGLDVHGGPDAWARWHMSATARLPRIAEVLPGVPSSVASVIDRMLEKKVERRFESAADALASLSAGALMPVSAPLETSRGVPAAPNALSSTPKRNVLAIEPVGLTTGEPVRVSERDAGMELFKGGSPIGRLVECAADKKNANALAAGLLLLGAFIAGASFIATPRHSSSETHVEDLPTTPPPVDNKPKEEAIVQEQPKPIEREEPSTTTVPLPPPPLPPQPGALVVTVEPPDAWVELDGRRLSGKSPWTLTVEPGAHVVRSGKNWTYLETVEHFDSSEGEPKRLELQLTSRPTPPTYDSLLIGISAHQSMVIEILNKLANDHQSVPLYRWAPMYAKGALDDDLRAEHAVALSALKNKRFDKAELWYARAAYHNGVSQHVRAAYSWPRKGLIYCLLAQGKTDEALHELQTFVNDVQEVLLIPGEPPTSDSARSLALDTARFAGQALAVIEAIRGTDLAADANLRLQDLARLMDQESRRALNEAREETLARLKEGGLDGLQLGPELVAQGLGNSTAREQRALLKSMEKSPPSRTGEKASWKVILLSQSPQFNQRPASLALMTDPERSATNLADKLAEKLAIRMSGRRHNGN